MHKLEMIKMFKKILNCIKLYLTSGLIINPHPHCASSFLRNLQKMLGFEQWLWHSGIMGWSQKFFHVFCLFQISSIL